MNAESLDAEIDQATSRLGRRRPASIQLDIVNHATNVSDTEARRVVAALQKQLDQDFTPVWGIECQLHYVPKSKEPNPAHWWIGLFDNSDAANALGYHDKTDLGLPLGKVFAETTKRYGGEWSCTLSHELLEVCADPYINVVVFMDAGFARVGNPRLCSYEVCDPCEDDSQGYKIDGVLVSDFVYPSYFEPNQKNAPYDKMGLITAPFQILDNGYLAVMEIGRPGGWTQITGRINATAEFPAGSVGKAAHAVSMGSVPARVQLVPGTRTVITPQIPQDRPLDGSRRQRRKLAYEGAEFLASTALGGSGK